MLRLAIALSVFGLASLHGESVETIKGIVHEAFLTPVTTTIALQAIPNEPPKEIQEKVPESHDPSATWLKGYWAFDAGRNDFIWISGLYRRSPPGHEWIAGFWKKVDSGFVYVPGFWSAQPQGSLKYIAETPPDSLEEKSDGSPGKGYFWASGYWTYDAASKTYNWLGGRFEKFDPNWMLVPAHYVWRPEGYVFIDSYWDFAIDQRGTLYASVYIPSSQRAGYTYQPVQTIDTKSVIENCFFRYPNYLYFYAWHYYYHSDYWIGVTFDPPWWGWSNWWSLDWANQWSLFWWWSHPGSVTPNWITSDLAAKIAPPSNQLVGLMKAVSPPAILVPEGVISGQALVKALGQPILPANKQQLKKAVDPLIKELPDLSRLRPNGKLSPQIADLAKPQFPLKYSVSLMNISKVPGKPIVPGKAATYRARPTTDETFVKPSIQQPVFPSRRPNLDMQRNSAIPRDQFKSKAPELNVPIQHEQYQPRQKVTPQSPYEETRYKYEPRRSNYEVPRETPTQYKMESYRPSSIRDDIYSPPASGSYAPSESIRTQLSKGIFSRPSVDGRDSESDSTREK